MQKKYLFGVLFCLAFLFFGNGAVNAEELVSYHKAGRVGVFSVEIEIPEKFNTDTSVFSAHSSNDKAYLLYVDSGQSVLSRMQGMDRHHLKPTQEQKEINDQLSELYKENNDIREKLNDARNKHQGLKTLTNEAEDNKDEVLLGALEGRLGKAEAEVDRLNAKANELNEQIQELNQNYRKLRQEAEKAFIEDKPKAEEVKKQSLKVYGRFNEGGTVRVDVFARDSSVLLARLERVASVEFELPGDDVDNPELVKKWAAAQAGEFSIHVMDSPYTSYYQYCLMQSKIKYGISVDVPFSNMTQRGRRGRGGIDLYSMTTGALAIQESLQLEEMTGRTAVTQEATVGLGEFEGPSIKSHPFDEMIKGKKYKLFPAASFVPYDNYYCRFSSISKYIEACDMMKTWGTSLLRGMSVSARDADVPMRYQDQLCIDITTATRLLGDFVIGEIGITGGDPFLTEGSDIAAIIEVKKRLIFDSVMKGYADKAVKGKPGTERSESIYDGVTIKSITSKDRSISSHSAYIGKYKVYANSLDMLKLVIDTYAKKRLSMADNIDFKYMRTIFPASDDDEDGFVYMSDAFIRKLLGAKWKIERQRSIICQNHMRMIGNAWAMYKSEMRDEGSIAKLIEEKYLNVKTTQCPDKGSYSVDESGRAFCSVHNCLRYCTPISGVGIEMATNEEANDYKQFVSRYNSFWSRYFDPIGIRLKLGDRTEVETCILPLIENSIYNQLRDVVGGKPVEMNSQLMTDGTIVSIGAKFSLDAKIRRQLQMMQKQLFPSLPEITSCLGDNISLNFYDSDVLFTFNENGFRMFGGWMNLEQQIMLGMVASSINLPIYAVLDLKDEELAGTFIRELLKVGQRKSGRGFLQFGFEPYSAGKYNGHEINTIACSFYVVKFRLHYAIASDRLIVSTKKYVLEKALDAIGDRQSGGKANVQLKVNPQAFDKIRDVVKLGWQERMRNACLKNIEPVVVLYENKGATEKTLNRLSKETTGVTLRCPSGGVYKYDDAREIAYCSVHGNRNHPSQPKEINDNEGLVDFMNRMKDFSVNFRFTDEGIMTKIGFDLDQKD